MYIHLFIDVSCKLVIQFCCYSVLFQSCDLLLMSVDIDLCPHDHPH